MVEACRTSEASGDLLINHSILLVDPQSGDMELIATVFDRPGLGIVSVRDDHIETVVSLGSRICQELAVVGVDTASPLPVTIMEGDRSSNLAAAVENPTNGCIERPRVDSPDWSAGPDPTLAFVASLEAIGRDGVDRLDAPGGLYLWSGEPVLQPAVTGLRHVRTVRWTPDGQSIAFGADVDGHGSGTWLYRSVNLADYAIVKWKPAREGDDLVARTSRLIDRLTSIDATLARWFVSDGTPRRRSEVPATGRSDFIATQAAAGPEFPDLAGLFLFVVWNGESGDRSAGLDVTDRMHLPFGDPPGKAMVHLPRTLGTDQVVAVLRTLVQVFEPDIGAVTSSSFFPLLDDGLVAGPVAYLPSDRYEVAAVPPTIVHESIGTVGHLLRRGDWQAGDPFDDDMTERLAAVVRPR